MKKRKLYPLFLALLTTVSGCNNERKRTETAPFLEAISYHAEMVNRYILVNEPLDFSPSYFLMTYSDASTETIPFNESIITTYDSSVYGIDEAEVCLNFDDLNYTFAFEYFVFDNDSNRTLIKAIDALPYLNKLTTDDVETIIDLLNTYMQLSEGEKDFLINHFSIKIERLRRSEKALIDAYFTEKEKELFDFSNTLNVGAYSEEALETIRNYCLEFAAGVYTSLQEVVDKYEEALQKINGVAKRELSLEEYRAETIAALKNCFVISLNSVVEEAGVYSFIETPKDYTLEAPISNIVVSFADQVAMMDVPAEIDELYTETYREIEAVLLPLFIPDAVTSINNVFLNTKNIEADLLNSWNSITISVSGLYDNILVDYLDDNRWWIPEAYRPSIILEKSEDELRLKTSIRTVVASYNDLVFEILRATLEKNLEMFYAIHRNHNPAYDTTDVFYWHVISDYFGDTPQQQFIYDGPLSEYRGVAYGNSRNNTFRLVGAFYNDAYRMRTSPALLAKYFELRTNIAPDPLAVKDIKTDLSQMKTEYNIGENLDLTNGKIIVTYNDTSTSIIEMSNEMIQGEVDMETSGNKTITLEFKDEKLNEDQTVSFSIVVLSDSDAFNEIITKITALREIDQANEEDIADILAILTLINHLSSDNQQKFAEEYPTEYQKLKNSEKKAAKLYGELSIKEPIHGYETLNYYVYDATSRGNLDTLYQQMINTSITSITFAAIDNAVQAFDDEYQALTIDATLNLEQFLNASLNSLNRLCEYQINQYGGTMAAVTFGNVTKTVKDETNVKPLYDDLVNAVSAVSSIEAATAIIAENIEALYSEIITAYSANANANLKQTMYDLRATISPLWNQDGNSDIIEMNGEGNGKMTTDYLDDDGYYCWYVPNAFQTGNLYSKISVGICASKYEIYKKYEFALVDMSRVTMYRNIIHAWLYGHMSVNWWQIIYYSPGFTYDGCLPEYEGNTYADSSFRLWGWGWRPGSKVTTVADLVEKYNYDIALYL
ncbi:MAG: bacterial Ig-like domain-containing protein [Bacilli bacterium]